MKKKRISIVLIIITILSCMPMLKANTITIESGVPTGISLKGFEKFWGFTIESTYVDSGSILEINTDYGGFALLKLSNNLQYPVIITGDIKLTFINPDDPPVFKNSPENEFLYEWLLTYNQIEGQLFGLKEKLQSLNNHDSDSSHLQIEMSELGERLQNQIGNLKKSEYIYARTLLEARVMKNSTYSLKTTEELDVRRQEFVRFVDANFAILQNSDMLAELCYQYFMMHEYVSYVDEEQKDIKAAKDLYQDYILSGVEEWTGVLSGRVDPKDVIGFCADLYYRRSMVSQAFRIFDHFRAHFIPKNTAELNPLFRIGETFPDFTLINSDHSIRRKLTSLNIPKLIAVISEKSLFSMVETIILARELAPDSQDFAVIIVPLEELSEDHLMMDRMVAEDLYFMDEQDWREEYLINNTFVPQFFFLDTDNKILR
ncbi:hypothetical protein JW877_06000 [bacterium]|nr:hypothetical protein [bacterium]